VPCVERIIEVVVEADVAVGAREGGLILATALRVEARLDRVRSDDLRDVIDEVECVVLVDERKPVVICEWEGVVGDAAEAEIRHITRADIREQLRDVDIVGARQRRVALRFQLDEIAARPKDEFVGQRGAECVCQCQHPVAARPWEGDRREREIQVARETAVGQKAFLGIVRVTGRQPRPIRDVVIYAQNVFAADTASKWMM
jgi:hypothetical protein